MRNRRALLAGLAASALCVAFAGTAAGTSSGPRDAKVIGRYKHLVVIYEENHSFDNLYGTWGRVNGQRVAGVHAPAARILQVAQNGDAFGCLLQKDVNLTSPPLSTRPGTAAAWRQAASHFVEHAVHDRQLHPGVCDDLPDNDGVRPPPSGVLNGTGLPGGCTRDLVHRFYQEQYQLDAGKQDRYVTGSDAAA